MTDFVELIFAIDNNKALNQYNQEVSKVYSKFIKLLDDLPSDNPID